MKQKLRNFLSVTSSYTEIYINALIIIGMLFFSVTFVKELYQDVEQLFSGNIEYNVQHFLSNALQLIIGIELVKMLAKHTTDSALDVLIFAIARKIIIEHSTSMLDLLLGVLAIAVLFLLKQHFLVKRKESDKDSIIINGATSTEKLNNQLGVHIPDSLGNTIAGVMANHLSFICHKATVGYRLSLEDVELEIYSMDEDLIKQVRVTAKGKRAGVSSLLNKHM